MTSCPTTARSRSRSASPARTAGTWRACSARAAAPPTRPTCSPRAAWTPRPAPRCRAPAARAGWAWSDPSQATAARPGPEGGGADAEHRPVRAAQPANPPVKAGDYVLQGRQDIAGGQTEPYDGHVRVTAPRYAMPADQILSTFPPANTEGAYENRLPQIVLKRRTLPWERAPKLGQRRHAVAGPGGHRRGRGHAVAATRRSRSASRPGSCSTGPNDVATGDYLSVTETVVDKVFPTEEDLPLLCHVREVDVRDTELANGDDDGFLAVVLANRLPAVRPHGRQARALPRLPGQPRGPARRPAASRSVDVVLAVPGHRARLRRARRRGGRVARSTPTASSWAASPARRSSTRWANARRGDAAPARAAGRRSRRRRVAAEPSTRAAGKATTSQWSTTQAARSSRRRSSARQEEAGRVVRDVMLEGFRDHVEHYVKLEPVYRFPVLAHWSFTVTGSGGFSRSCGRSTSACSARRPRQPDVPPGAPPPPPPPRPPAELAETGHVGLPHLTRRGDRVRAWFRGPLAAASDRPRDAPGADGRLPARPRQRPAAARRPRRPRGRLARRGVRDRPAARALAARGRRAR